MNLGHYNKTFATLVVGALGWASQVVASKPHAITSAEWIGLATIGAAAFGVNRIANDPPAPPPVAPPAPEPVVPPLP